jgi:hypothetical protein
VVIDAKSAKRVSIKKLARVISNESLINLFPTEALKLLQGPILMNFNTIHNIIYFLLPRTKGLFVLRLTKDKLVPEFIGELSNVNDKIIGVIGSYSSDKDMHNIYLYDKIGGYEINFRVKHFKSEYEEKLTEVNV